MKTEKRHTIPEIRHARFRRIKRNKGICDRCYGDGDTYKKYPGMYSKQKIHCSCPMCAEKTNSRQLGYEMNWKHSDQKKIDSMNDDLKEYYNELFYD